MLVPLLINVAVFGAIYGATYGIAKWRGASSPRLWAISVTIAAAVVSHYITGASVSVH